MKVARFYRGPYDGQVLTIPELTEIYMIPEFGSVTIEYYYYLAGQLAEHAWAYLYDEYLFPYDKL